MSGIEPSRVPTGGKRLQIYQRDEAYLEMARQIFLEEGFHNLTFARLANATGFSRGVLYERFGSKEGLLVELGLRCRAEMQGGLRRANNFPGRARERVVALAEAMRRYTHRYEDNMRIISFIDADAVAERVSSELRAKLEKNHLWPFLMLKGIVEDGVRDGDLALPEKSAVETLSLGLWAMMVGLFSNRGLTITKQLAVADPLAETSKNAHLLCDAYGWKPLYKEWDYGDTLSRIAAYLDLETSPEEPSRKEDLTRTVR